MSQGAQLLAALSCEGEDLKDQISLLEVKEAGLVLARPEDEREGTAEDEEEEEEGEEGEEDEEDEEGEEEGGEEAEDEAGDGDVEAETAVPELEPFAELPELSGEGAPKETEAPIAALVDEDLGTEEGEVEWNSTLAEPPVGSASSDIVGEIGANRSVLRSADLDDLTKRSEPKESCLSVSNASGYILTEVSLAQEDFSVSASCAWGFSGTARATRCAKAQEEYLVAGCRAACVAPTEAEAKCYRVTEVSLAFEAFDVSAACASDAGAEAAAARCARPGEAYELRGCRWSTQEVNAYARRLEAFASDLERHLAAATRAADFAARVPPSAAAERAAANLAALRAAGAGVAREASRRLGARFARLDPRSPDSGVWQEFEAIAREAEEALAPVRGGTPAFAPASAGALAAGERCRGAALAQAARRFEELAEGFGGAAAQMLPREVETLHRVLHSLQVLQASLEATDADDADASPAESAASECQRYLQGLQQLEADLAHYRGLDSTPKAPKEPPGPRRFAPPQPAAPVRQLEPLELKTRGESEQSDQNFARFTAKRPRHDATPPLVSECVLHFVGAEPDPPQMAPREGRKLRQSKEITQQFPDSPIAKKHRGDFVWVCKVERGFYSMNPADMTCLEKIEDRSQIGQIGCDICGKNCGLDSFIGYISKGCGEGLLGVPSQTSRLRAQVLQMLLQDHEPGSLGPAIFGPGQSISSRSV
ncbi:unnamed protein product [Effrenium voratum]|nr:unnamed protein product [Effrenium voratum]